MRVNLGDDAKDEISGFRGIVVARTEWLNGCARVTLQPRKLKPDGTMQLNETFDEMQITLVKAGAVKAPKPEPEAPQHRRTGGPRPEPTRAHDPR